MNIGLHRKEPKIVVGEGIQRIPNLDLAHSQGVMQLNRS